MSLGQVASQPQQSAPSAPPPASPPPSSAEPPKPNGSTPLAPVGDGKPSGAPDWRAALAGDDAKAIEQLARYQSPSDFLKAHNELRGKLSQRAEPARLADNATPEQIAEYRKGLGLPDVAKDAKPDAYLDAYKITAPNGYEMSEPEKGMLADYAKLAFEQGHSPREVKAATDFFFQQQAAQTQALNRIAVDFQKKEQNGLRDRLGSAEYEAQQAAGEAWLKEQFKDNPDSLADVLNAQLPSGGKLGDSGWFFELVAKQAVGAGYTDRIEANALEAGGKSLAQQQTEIENLRFKDKAAYDAAMKQGGKYERILSARVARGEIDEFGNDIKRRRSA